ncbi:hypothetical protein UA08_00230 [Talaromyces atroroseus]|uniref:Uncharacterized protein n=1 Tax=Talaromyces atroroseus TaxID=1441469 RepID=A0A225B865_TALAT|nr:hypothetical protein UA08_00230 [Talaromyces atroroseus]OKL64279.1 hypothetical protein UA08_00230 [Talaromyces atroroseus]
MRIKGAIKEPPERLERRKFLFQLEARIEAREENEFMASQLRSLGIDVQHMSLDESSDSKPNFFTPRPNVPEATDDDLEDRYEALTANAGTAMLLLLLLLRHSFLVASASSLFFEGRKAPGL